MVNILNRDNKEEMRNNRVRRRQLLINNGFNKTEVMKLIDYYDLIMEILESRRWYDSSKEKKVILDVFKKNPQLSDIKNIII
jgi:hypothetical protein